MHPRNEAEFLCMIEKVDRLLSDREVSVPQRPLLAICEFSRMVGEGLPLAPLAGDTTMPGSYRGVDLSRRVMEWYRKRYGDSLKMTFCVGRIAFMVRGDIWLLRLPRIYGGGKIIFFCSKTDESTLPRHPVIVKPGQARSLSPARYNVFDSAVDFPRGLIKSLTEEEMTGILNVFMIGLNAFERLTEIRHIGMIDCALGDYDSAVSHLIEKPSRGAQAKWASAQAVEKIVKTFMSLSGHEFPRIHKLHDLVSQAESLGLPHVNTDWIDAVDCKPGVRYGEIPVSLKEALTAHHASLLIGAHVAEAIKIRMQPPSA